MGANAWSIGEVARRSGLRSSALRYYEHIGLLPQAERVSGQRRYDASVLTRLSVIELAQRAGFTLSQTRTLLEGFAAGASPSERWRALAQQKLPEVEAMIERAHTMKRLLEEGLECGCPSLEECDFLVANADPISEGTPTGRTPRPARRSSPRRARDTGRGESAR